MEPFTDLWNIITLTTWMLLLLMDTNQALDLPCSSMEDEAVGTFSTQNFEAMETPILDMLSFIYNSVHQYRLCCSTILLTDEMSFWVKPRSTTWFSRFLLEQYNNTRWLSMFRMTKESVFTLADLLKPHIQKKNMKFRLIVPVLVRVACTLFKLTHGANLTVCSEMSAIGKNIVNKVVREVVHAVNNTLKQEITWPVANRLHLNQAKFQDLYSLLGVVGVIDGVHFSISKPTTVAADYFYFKFGAYSMNCQTIVDSDKRFLDLYVGMPGSTNDSRMLRQSTLHFLTNCGDLMDSSYSVDGHAPYLIGDLGYPLLPWLMVPHHGGHTLSIFESLFNKRLRKGRCVVKNAFGILKHSFRELFHKSDLSLAFLPDVVVCCCILHNMLLKKSPFEVENLLRLLRSEGLQPDLPPGCGSGAEHGYTDIDDMAAKAVRLK